MLRYMKDNRASPIKSFPVHEILKSHGIEKIMLSGTSCIITRNDDQEEITFDMGKAAEQTLKNFSRAARALKLDERLTSAIKFYFIQEYYNKHKEEVRKKGVLELRKLDEGEGDFDKFGEAQQKERQRRTKLEYQEVTISQCARMEKDAVKIVGGMISGVQKIEKMIAGAILKCDKCDARYEYLATPRPLYINEIENLFFGSRSRNRQCRNCGKGELYSGYGENQQIRINAVRSELQEIDSTKGVETLPIILLEDCTNEIMNAGGKSVTIFGEIFVIQVSKKKLMTFVFVYDVKYLDKEESMIELSNSDLKSFEKLAGCSDIMNILERRFAITVFGHEDIKKAILISAANTGIDSARFKRRIHIGLIGETGLAKTKLLYAARELVPKSRLCSAPTSSSKSLIAIVDKDNELGTMIRHGDIVLANGAICAIDEVGRMPFEDQGRLLNAFQEGKIPFSKYGYTLDLGGSATFIVSANPQSHDGKFRNPDIIEADEIPLLAILRDRLDLIFIVRGKKDEDFLEEYANNKLQQIGNDEDVREEEESNHKLLRKYIAYCKEEFKPKPSAEMVSMFSRYYRQMGILGSPRMVEALYNIGFAIARLKQKSIIGAEEAEEAMKLYNKQLENWSELIKIPADPRVYVRDKIIDVLRGSLYDRDFVDLVEVVCKNDRSAAAYIGDDLKVESNKKLRAVRDMFTDMKLPDIMIVSQKPLSLAWEPTYDWNPNKEKFDPAKMETAWIQNEDHKSQNNLRSVESVESDGSVANHKNVPEESTIGAATTDLTDPNDPTDQTKNNKKTEYEKNVERQRERFDRELGRSDSQERRSRKA